MSESLTGYGPEVVRRLSYSTLINNPELAMQSLLSFIGEPGTRPHVWSR